MMQSLVFLFFTFTYAKSITNTGLTISFNETASPVSLKNTNGDELLGADSIGFTLRTDDFKGVLISEIPFNTIVSHGVTEYTFGMSDSAERLEVTFSGANHYLTANITSTKGFEFFDGKSVYFYLNGKEDNVLRGMALNYMIYDSTGEGHPPVPNPSLHLEAPWDNSVWNPRPRFAVYEVVDAVTEDETLFDLWVDEGISHPRVDGEWDRAAAKMWMDGWVKENYDASAMGMVPRNLSEWRMFFPLGLFYFFIYFLSLSLSLFLSFFLSLSILFF